MNTAMSEVIDFFQATLSGREVRFFREEGDKWRWEWSDEGCGDLGPMDPCVEYEWVFRDRSSKYVEYVLRQWVQLPQGKMYWPSGRPRLGFFTEIGDE